MKFLTVLHEAVVALKGLRRTGWVERGVRDPESVADHSYGVALLALLLAEERRAAGEDIDVLGVVRMALLHDLPESETGDLSPRQRRERYGADDVVARNEQREAEARAMTALLERASSSLRVSWQESWQEYREGRSPEAKLVRDVDKMECLLQTLSYERGGQGKQLGEFGRLIDSVGDAGLRAYLLRRWSGRVAK